MASTPEDGITEFRTTDCRHSPEDPSQWEEGPSIRPDVLEDRTYDGGVTELFLREARQIHQPPLVILS